MKEIVTQSDLIIENSVYNETFPLYTQRSVEDEIAELELIIESKETNDVKSLNFKKLNNNSILNNSFNIRKFVGMN